ncbi:MAG: hypothetical protein IPH07_27065 [Deltaproteobacteria bacterium]|jgi:uncharacterized membrane protein (DUF441 family)|nr:hypothetical protein [Deltaproteobacteria bacterium]MBK8240291.1 hypothetical protein [Deltaproteobacteria bacterium]MBK8714554.1 hypothetical protein [Deltaproteobacteria bacterium]MBP7291568.1 hypothetical protein [Nannocystaceae bacterium]
MLEFLLDEGRFVDVALVAIVAEFAIVAGVVRARRAGSRLRVLDVGGQLLAGALLLAALRVALAGGDPLWVVALTTASLPAHLFDLSRRVAASR